MKTNICKLFVVIVAVAILPNVQAAGPVPLVYLGAMDGSAAVAIDS